MSKAKRGRPKGSSNKITNEVKRAMLMAFDKIGGAQRLADWITKHDTNEMLWWTRMFIRLAPRPPVEAAPGPEMLPPVRGALLWEKPTPAPYKHLIASTAAGAVAAAVAGAEAPEAGEPPG